MFNLKCKPVISTQTSCSLMGKTHVTASTRSAWWLPVLLLLAITVTVKAGDFFCEINADGTLTISFYTGPSGAVVIPSAIEGRTVTGIGDDTFGGRSYSPNTNLTSVTIPDSVTSIGNDAFYFCANLTNVAIPNSVTRIGDEAFAASGLMRVTIPNSVTNIGNGAFGECTGLASIVVDVGNSVYSSTDGVLFNKDQTTFIQYPSGKAGSYTIPDSVTRIGDWAFDRCTSLTSVTIPNSVTNIGQGAFYSCTSLTSMTIPNSVTNIGDWAFYQCTSLTSVTIPNSVTRIGTEAFYQCTSLTSVTIPNSVTNIGEAAFRDCECLASIVVDVGNSVYSSTDGVLFNKGQTTLIQYPGGKAGSYTIPDSVTSIGACVFENCGHLTSVTIPDSVTSIGSFAFKDCASLTSVTIGSGVASIGYRAFFGCPRLSGIYFEGNAPSIDGSILDSYGSRVLVYHMLGTTGWWPIFCGRATVPWIPLIGANGQVGDVHVNRGEPVVIEAQTMNVGPYLGLPVDWWVLALANSSCYYLNDSVQWMPFDGNMAHCHPAFQGALFNLPATVVLNQSDLPAGSYTFWFAVSYPMTGVLDPAEQVLAYSVNVTVQ